MITEHIFIVQIKIIIADPHRITVPLSKLNCQRSHPDDNTARRSWTIFHVWRYLIPFSGLFPQIAIIHQTPSASQKHLHRLCDSLTDPDTVSQRSDDLMGIRLFQLIIVHIFTDKIMHILFFFQLRKLRCRTHQLLHPRMRVLSDARGFCSSQTYIPAQRSDSSSPENSGT